jgi:DNA-binding transcriptional LysR family regulator
MLRDEPLLMFPRAAGPTLFDTIIAACREAGFEPELGQSAPQLASLVTLVAADPGFSIVPASMRQVADAGVIYRELAGVAPLARLALATPARRELPRRAEFRRARCRVIREPNRQLSHGIGVAS